MINSNINQNINRSFFLTPNIVNNISGGVRPNQTVPVQPPQLQYNQPQPQEQKPKKKNLATWILGASAGTLILGVTALSIISPRFFSKNINKLNAFFKKKSAQALSNSKTKKFYDKAVNFTNWGMEKINSVNHFNNLKDIGYDKLCKAKCIGGENSLLAKANNHITKFFRKLSQNTVYRSYHTTDNSYNNLIDMVKTHKGKFSSAEWTTIEKNIDELQDLLTQGFSNKAISNRLRQQEIITDGLEKKVLDKSKEMLDRKKFKGKSFKEKAHVVDENLRFVSEDLLAKDKEIYTQQVKKFSEAISNSKGDKGKVQELLSRLKGKLPEKDYEALVQQAERAEKKLNTGVINETHKYFDKNRDLVLGSAPTDVLTIAATGAVAAGVIATANDKDERISKSLTRGIPIISSIATSFMLSARLVSGTTSILLGGLSGLLAAKLGEIVDTARIAKKEKRQQKFNNLVEQEIQKRAQLQVVA